MTNVDRALMHGRIPPPTPLPILTLSLVWGGGGGIIPEFRFHSAVIVGGGKGEGRWGLWEPCEDKEQRGNPVV